MQKLPMAWIDSQIHCKKLTISSTKKPFCSLDIYIFLHSSIYLHLYLHIIAEGGWYILFYCSWTQGPYAATFLFAVIVAFDSLDNRCVMYHGIPYDLVIVQLPTSPGSGCFTQGGGAERIYKRCLVRREEGHFVSSIRAFSQSVSLLLMLLACWCESVCYRLLRAVRPRLGLRAPRPSNFGYRAEDVFGIFLEKGEWRSDILSLSGSATRSWQFLRLQTIDSFSFDLHS